MMPSFNGEFSPPLLGGREGLPIKTRYI